MKLLPWQVRQDQIAIEDERMRQNVARAMTVLDRHRGYDWHKGYREGKTRGFLLGIVTAVCVLGVIGCLWALVEGW
jgi:hypothetical protein